MRRVLVFGGDGMLGRMVIRVLSQSGQMDIEHTSRKQGSGYFYDVEDGRDRLQVIMDQHGPFDYVVNCIGVLSRHIDALDPASLRCAIRVNALFPHELATLTLKSGARVIHISTDGVFSGAADGAYLEDAPHDCVDIYGKTKSLGEVRQPRFLNLRCSIIGPDPLRRGGLLEWFLGQPDGKKLVGYTNLFWNGVTTLQFAELCRKIMLEDAFGQICDESPIHHFCPNSALSKHDLLEIFRLVFKKNVAVIPTSVPGKGMSRILATRYQSLPKLFGCDLSMQQAVESLQRFGV